MRRISVSPVLQRGAPEFRHFGNGGRAVVATGIPACRWRLGQIEACQIPMDVKPTFRDHPVRGTDETTV